MSPFPSQLPAQLHHPAPPVSSTGSPGRQAPALLPAAEFLGNMLLNQESEPEQLRERDWGQGDKNRDALDPELNLAERRKSELSCPC